MDLDTTDPLQMGLLLLGLIIALIFVIKMDMRKLPLGKVKMFPWTLTSIGIVFAGLTVAKILLKDLISYI